MKKLTYNELELKIEALEKEILELKKETRLTQQEIEQNRIDEINKRVNPKVREALWSKERDYLYSILFASQVGIGATRHRVIEFANQGLSKMLGYPVEELVGDNTRKLYFSEKQYLEIWEAIQEELSQKDVCEITTTFRKKDGQKIDVLLNFTSLYPGEPEKGITYIVVDITKQQDKEKQLLEAYQRADDLSKLKTVFIENISHEIRTPLNGIIGFSELIHQDELSVKKRNEYIDLIRESGYQLLNIISNMIDMSKIQANDVVLTSENVCLIELVEEVVFHFSQKLKKLNKNHLNLEISIDNSIRNTEILTDTELLRKTLYHILDNAVKFTHNGEIEIGVSMLSGDMFQFYIKDTGIGISKENLNLITDKFRQVEINTSTKKYSGIGLGLSISKGIIELLGGELWIVSELNTGTTVFFNIKATVCKPEYIYNNSIFEVSNVKYDWKNKRLLIVEDDILNSHFLGELLKINGAKISHAVDGTKAIDYCKNTSIDLILMDILLPMKNGIDAIAEIRDFLPYVPILVQTAITQEETRNACYENGCNEYITKPINIQMLLSTIDNYLK